MPWAYGFAATTGAIHGEEEGQDRCDCRTLRTNDGEPVLVAAVSDGAGSSSRGGEGAELACRCFLTGVEKALAKKRGKSASGMRLGRKDLSKILHDVRESIVAVASFEGVRLAEYSCTLVGALAFKNEAWFVQIGDGAATYRMADEFEVALWPETTEYVNTSAFVTDANADERLLIRHVKGAVRELALFSDGIQYMVLDLKSQSPHQPFFNAIVKPLCQEGEGFSERYSGWLEKTLGSPQVTTRSDDDTSIVVARRLD